MKKRIKSSQITRFKSISHIEYGTYDYPRRVYFPYQNHGIYRGILDNIMEFKERSDNETDNEFFRVNVAGKIMNFRLSYEHDCPAVYFHPSEKESAIESIHNYFLDFFDNTVEYQWYQWITDDEDSIPNFHQLALSISFDSKKYGRRDVESLEKFFASSPVIKRVDMQLDTSYLFRPESKFYQVESVHLKLYSHAVPTFLRHFQGRQAFLSCYYKWNILDLIEFMHRWKSGEECRKLEYLKMELSINEIPQDQILNALGVKHIDESNTPPTHELPLAFWSGFDPNTDPIVSHSYVVRNTDNRVASVSIQNNWFCFGVWKETEQEFLRMVT
ncbi:hypothetical protein B9Z55_009624 [Caenorhabditis nigoni]|nr:hypothetical protein B9Z55_009624 [Caenorhabditis nigoni]